jgi:predicted ferric reductase
MVLSTYKMAMVELHVMWEQRDGQISFNKHTQMPELPVSYQGDICTSERQVMMKI